jgi:hypothetical protein
LPDASSFPPELYFLSDFLGRFVSDRTLVSPWAGFPVWECPCGDLNLETGASLPALSFFDEPPVWAAVTEGLRGSVDVPNTLASTDLDSAAFSAFFPSFASRPFSRAWCVV